MRDDQHSPLGFDEVLSTRVTDRGEFLSRTYFHLLLAIFAFVGIEAAFFQTAVAERLTSLLLGGGSLGWLAVLGGFMILGWIATHVAHSAESLAAQYLALAAYVLGEAIIFAPLLYIADNHFPGAIQSAALITVLAFLALTAVIFWTRQDFTFLRGMLCWGGILAIGAIVCGAVFGIDLGVWFSIAMIGFAGAAILYDTSNVLHHYPEDRYVAASLQLFASVALMFWYVLRLMMSLRKE